jgi:uncharacterized membrane protein YkoI
MPFLSTEALGAPPMPKPRAVVAPTVGPISPEVAVKKALEVVPGRVLKITEKQQGERVVYRVKVLTAKGRVVVVSVDVQTGEISH